MKTRQSSSMDNDSCFKIDNKKSLFVTDNPLGLPIHNVMCKEDIEIKIKHLRKEKNIMTKEEEAIKYLQDVKYPKVNYDDVLALQRCMIVEPKFKVGDWIVYKNDICQIVKREEGCNKLVTVFGIIKELVNERNLSTARLWTIQDAKDGDVLCSYPEYEYPWIGIFHRLNIDKYSFTSHCYLQAGLHGKFCPPSGVNIFGERNVDKHSLNVVPATKEQRDLLLSKMKEAGYEWDMEKKELEKIEQKPKEKYEWSEEDENMIEDIIEAIDTQYAVSDYNDMVSWLKSLKERMKGE